MRYLISWIFKLKAILTITFGDKRTHIRQFTNISLQTKVEGGNIVEQ